MITLYDTDYEDLNGDLLPYVVKFEDIREIFLDKINSLVIETSNMGFLDNLFSKKYCDGYKDALEDTYKQIKKKTGKIIEEQFRPRTWRGLSSDKRFSFCMHCKSDLTKYPEGIKYCPECGRCFMSPAERKKIGLVPEK